MAKIQTNFKTETQLGTTSTELIAVDAAAASVSVVRATSFFNQSATDVQTVTVYRFLTTGAASDDSIIAVKDIAPRKTWNSGELQGKVIAPGYTLSATATTAATVNAECDGVISS